MADLSVDRDAKSSRQDAPGDEAMQTEDDSTTTGMSDRRSKSRQDGSAEEAHDSQSREKSRRSKQFEFDGEGWEDVGDSEDEEDHRLLGNVGQGEDDYYDPDMDDLDQQFVDNRRRRHLPPAACPGPQTLAEPKPPRGRRAREAPGGSDTPATGARARAEDEASGDSRRDAAGEPAATGAVQRDDAPQSALESASGDASMRSDGDGAGAGEHGASCSSSGRQTSCSAQDWRAYVAPSGHEYYHNSVTGETTWIKPRG